ncbi:metal ABC transporter permease [Streptomyces sp. NBC_01190]|uniref:metal ABC transporter permease n=1 Tax=Streptomyces sp. NBC_01190 TaxID=2903767 RepID=UPI0038695341|nr:metal ABC transporter permease [Streptomyces sp. NBC_01190]
MNTIAAGWPGALGHPFFLHAVLAGGAIAAASGMTGYFLVLRAQVFTGDALSHMAFTGSLAALACGVDLRIGLYAATVAVALLLGTLARSGRADDVAIGNVFAWITGLGAFFLTLYTTSRGASDGGAGVRVLFGSIFGLSAAQTTTAVAVAAVVCLALLAVFRPLLFASVDEAVAAARGVPVRILGFAFLALVGVTAAEATQAVGSLLLLGLLAAPAGAAQRLTDRPGLAFALSTVLAVAEMWAGLAVSYAVPRLPPSFAIVAVATAVHAAAFVLGPRRPRAGAGVLSVGTP